MNARGLPVNSSEPDLKKQASASTVAALKDAAVMRHAPPFIASHDIVRGIAYAGHSLLQFAFMLIIM